MGDFDGGAGEAETLDPFVGQASHLGEEGREGIEGGIEGGIEEGIEGEIEEGIEGGIEEGIEGGI